MTQDLRDKLSTCTFEQRGKFRLSFVLATTLGIYPLVTTSRIKFRRNTKGWWCVLGLGHVVV